MLDTLFLIGVYTFIGIVSLALFAMIHMLFKEYWMNLMFYRKIPKRPKTKYKNLCDDDLLLGQKKIIVDKDERSIEL